MKHWGRVYEISKVGGARVSLQRTSSAAQFRNVVAPTPRCGSIELLSGIELVLNGNHQAKANITKTARTGSPCYDGARDARDFSKSLKSLS